ncbi:MAG: hypothetical protein IJX99_03365 [Clostridia bacterium]|nr:hypothetical protein [Clostridia bacterium]
MNYREKTKLVDGLCGAFLMALLVESFYALSDYAYTIYHYSISSVTTIIYVLAGIALAIAVAVLIAAYRKDNLIMATYGIELLVLAITAAIIPGTYISLPFPFNKLNLVFPLVFGVYYVGKVMMLLSKNNCSNVAFMSVIELIYILLLSYGLLTLTKPLFFIGSVASIITFIMSMKKKSKSLLAHGLEVMLVSFSMLLINSSQSIVFLSVFVGIYYLAKTFYRFLNPEKTNKKAKRRK